MTIEEKEEIVAEFEKVDAEIDRLLMKRLQIEEEAEEKRKILRADYQKRLREINKQRIKAIELLLR